MHEEDFGYLRNSAPEMGFRGTVGFREAFRNLKKKNIYIIKNRINFWKKKVSNGSFAMFHWFDEAHEECIEFNFAKEIYNHLDVLSKKFQHYFHEDVRIGNLWILNPFMCDIASEDVNFPTDTKDELLQLSEDSNLKLSFKGKELLYF